MNLSQTEPSTFADHLTVTKAAEYLGVSARTLRGWDQAGKLKAKRHPINGYRLYERPALENILSALRQKGAGAV